MSVKEGLNFKSRLFAKKKKAYLTYFTSGKDNDPPVDNDKNALFLERSKGDIPVIWSAIVLATV